MSEVKISIAFISNYLNHHQIPLSDNFYRLTDGKYYFIQTEPMEQERQNLGWNIDENTYPYLIKSYEEPQRVIEIVKQADVVIAGSAPDDLVNCRLSTGKLLFGYSERVYKKGQWRALSPRGLYYMTKRHGKSAERNMFMLCASAYAPCDYSIYHLYPSRMLKWGYFPYIEKKTFEQICESKTSDKIQIIWCARFIDWKHPEMVISIAQKLKSTYGSEAFHITMVGTGPLRGYFENQCNKKKLNDVITFEGPLKPEEVRSRMLEMDVLLATSDYNEGWGAVINEGMGSGCCVVASHAMGAVPYLICHKQNGLIFKSKSMRSLYLTLQMLFEKPELIREYGRAAYDTVLSSWNAEVAAERFIGIAQKMLSTGEISYELTGPCSKAEVVGQNSMFKYLTRRG